MEVDGPAPVPGLHHRQGTWLDTRPTPKTIQDFVDKRYHYDHYVTLTQRANDLIVKELKTLKDSNGQPVQAKVSCRAKEKDSLEKKLNMRNDKRIKNGQGPYETEDEIWDDIHDLAGVRILLYIPNQDQYDKVTEMIQSIWGSHVKPRPHPEPTEVPEEQNANVASERKKEKAKKGYTPRHLGYKAIHYRVSMVQEDPLQTSAGLYGWVKGDRVEVQVVSALGHAWAEAEHQVKYKSYAYGPPTEEEERLLDTLSGLVSSGELLLEQFSKLVNKRTYAKMAYRDDFGTFLRGLDILQRPELQMEDGDEQGYASDFGAEGVDILFRFLIKRGQNYPLAVRNALKKLGYPETPHQILQEVLRSFTPRLQPPEDLVAPLCLIRSMLLESKQEQHSELLRTDYRLSKKCCILINALTLLQTFAGGSGAAKDWLKDNIESGLNETQQLSLNFVLANSRRRKCLTEDDDVDVQERLGPELQPVWEWFQDQAIKTESICGLCFQLAEMEVTKEVDVNMLLRGLSIGSMSRSGTAEFD